MFRTPQGSNPNEVKPLSPTFQVGLFALLGLSILSKLYLLDHRSFFFDELYSVNAALEPRFTDFLDRWVLYDNSPPLYYLLLRAWFVCMPATEFGARFLSLILSIAAGAALIVGLKRRFAGETWIYGALLCGTSYSFLFFAQEARCYSLLMLLAVFQLLTMVDILRLRNQSIPSRLALRLGFLTVLSAYTHYSGIVFSTLLLSLTAVALRRNRPALLQLFKTGCLIVLCGIPWLPYFIFNLTVEKFVVVQSFGERLKVLLAMIFFGHTTPSRIFQWIAIVSIAGIASRAQWRAIKDDPGAWALVVSGGVSALIIGLSGLNPVMRGYRHFIVFIPAVLAGTAIVLSRASMRLPCGVLAFVCSALIIIQGSSHYLSPREEWRHAVKHVVDSAPGVPLRVIIVGKPWDRPTKHYLSDGGETALAPVFWGPFYRYYFNRLAPHQKITFEVLEPATMNVPALVKSAALSGEKLFVLQYTGGIGPTFSPDEYLQQGAKHYAFFCHDVYSFPAVRAAESPHRP